MPAVSEIAYIQRMRLLAIADQKQSDQAGYSSTIAKIIDDNFLSDEAKLDEAVKHTKGFLEAIVLHKAHPFKSEMKKQLAAIDAFDSKTFEPNMSFEEKARHIMQICIDMHVNLNIKDEFLRAQFKKMLHNSVNKSEDSQKEILTICQNIKLTKMIFDEIDSACSLTSIKEKCKHTLIYGPIAESLDRPMAMNDALQKYLAYGLNKEMAIENYKKFETLTKVISQVCDEKKQEKLKSELTVMTDKLKQQCTRGEIKSEDAYQHTWNTLQQILEAQSKKKSSVLTIFQPSVSAVAVAISSILKTTELSEAQQEFSATSPRNKSPSSRKSSFG